MASMMRACSFTILVLATSFAVFAQDPQAKRADVAPPESYKSDQLSHWAFQPPQRTTPPDVKESSWVKNPIDRFILADLESVGFLHAPEADRISLIRRV